GTVCVVGKMRDLILQLSKSSIYSTKPMIESKMVKKVSRTVVREVTNSIPLKRLGKCEEVANTIVYLSSSASSYIVGQTIVIDGGMVMR
ncbi:SDR family oxidoreductase, partial [Klebsiella oxytoca]